MAPVASTVSTTSAKPLEKEATGTATATATSSSTILETPSEETPAPTVDGKKENTPPSASVNGSSASNKQKKKKKSKPQTSDPPGVGAMAQESTNSTAQGTTENDEALAMKLQNEEESMAHRTPATEGQADVWEEVTTRKRKGAKQEITAD